GTLNLGLMPCETITHSPCNVPITFKIALRAYVVRKITPLAFRNERPCVHRKSRNFNVCKFKPYRLISRHSKGRRFWLMVTMGLKPLSWEPPGTNNTSHLARSASLRSLNVCQNTRYGKPRSKSG